MRADRRFILGVVIALTAGLLPLGWGSGTGRAFMVVAEPDRDGDQRGAMEAELALSHEQIEGLLAERGSLVREVADLKAAAKDEAEWRERYHELADCLARVKGDAATMLGEAAHRPSRRLTVHHGTRGMKPVSTSQADGPARMDALALALSHLPMAPPVVPIHVNSGYGPRGRAGFHWGLDLGAPLGSPVHAAGAGTVVLVKALPDMGLTVEIDHGSGLRSRYAHLARASVETGQTVAMGEPIGRVGMTGRSTGPHLHFEVDRRGRTIDPAPLLAVAAGVACPADLAEGVS